MLRKCRRPVSCRCASEKASAPKRLALSTDPTLTCQQTTTVRTPYTSGTPSSPFYHDTDARTQKHAKHTSAVSTIAAKSWRFRHGELQTPQSRCVPLRMSSATSNINMCRFWMGPALRSASRRSAWGATAARDWPELHTFCG